MTRPSSSTPKGQENPKSGQDEEVHARKKEQEPQSPQTQTLEIPDPQNPEHSDSKNPQDHQENRNQEETQEVVDQEQQAQDHSEQQAGMSRCTPDAQVTVSDPPPLTSPFNPHRRQNKRKKGKLNIKKQQAIEKKLQTLMENLKPIPFRPSKTLDFSKHEKLLKGLGLWDFVHIQFDQTIRVDLVAQLIATYDPKLRCSYVNEYRIAVNRADLARALKLPVKKEKGVNLLEGVDLDSEVLSEEFICFIDGIVSNWVLLHEDMWMMPSEVLNWSRVIKDGHPEKVDWASLVWYMVEKELTQGDQLGDCYYASHLQYLIKSQREEVMMEGPKVEVEMETKEEEDGGNDGDVKMIDPSAEPQGKDDVVLEEPSIELTLGHDVIEKEEVKDEQMMDVEESKEEGHREWASSGNDSVDEHFLQPCNLRVGGDLDGHDESKEEAEEDEEEKEVEEEEDDRFNIAPNDDALEDDGLTGNLVQGMLTTQIPFGLAGELRGGQTSGELLVSRAETHIVSGGPSFFANGGKREIEHEDDIPHSFVGSNKRLRTDGQWDHKSPDFGMCMEQIQQWMTTAKMMYEEKEQVCEQATMHQHTLLNEVQRRDNVIEHLQKIKYEEIEKRDSEIYRLERELFVMGNLLEGYRKALKETDKAFSEYRQRCQLPEEPIYKDAGPGGVVLSTSEIEKQRLKQEEEDRLKLLALEEKAKEVEQEYIGQFKTSLEKIDVLDKSLSGLENDVKLLEELSAKRRVSVAPDSPPS